MSQLVLMTLLLGVVAVNGMDASTEADEGSLLQRDVQTHASELFPAKPKGTQEVISHCHEEEWGSLCYKKCPEGEKRWSGAQCGSSIGNQWNEHCNTDGGHGSNGIWRQSGCIKMTFLSQPGGEACPNTEDGAKKLGKKETCLAAAKVMLGEEDKNGKPITLNVISGGSQAFNPPGCYTKKGAAFWNPTNTSSPIQFGKYGKRRICLQISPAGQ